VNLDSNNGTPSSGKKSRSGSISGQQQQQQSSDPASSSMSPPVGGRSSRIAALQQQKAAAAAADAAAAAAIEHQQQQQQQQQQQWQRTSSSSSSSSALGMDQSGSASKKPNLRVVIPEDAKARAGVQAPQQMLQGNAMMGYGNAQHMQQLQQQAKMEPHHHQQQQYLQQHQQQQQMLQQHHQQQQSPLHKLSSARKDSDLAAADGAEGKRFLVLFINSCHPMQPCSQSPKPPSWEVRRPRHRRWRACHSLVDKAADTHQSSHQMAATAAKWYSTHIQPRGYILFLDADRKVARDASHEPTATGNTLFLAHGPVHELWRHVCAPRWPRAITALFDPANHRNARGPRKCILVTHASNVFLLSIKLKCFDEKAYGIAKGRQLPAKQQ